MFRGRVVAVVAWLALVPVAAASELPDPMRPPDFQAPSQQQGEASPSRPGLSLQSTLISGDRRSAVIDGRSVHVGASIQGARVVAIGPTRVKLRDDNRVFTLRLPSVGIRRRANGGKSE